MWHTKYASLLPGYGTCRLVLHKVGWLCVYPRLLCPQSRYKDAVELLRIYMLLILSKCATKQIPNLSVM